MTCLKFDLFWLFKDFLCKITFGVTVMISLSRQDCLFHFFNCNCMYVSIPWFLSLHFVPSLSTRPILFKRRVEQRRIHGRFLIIRRMVSGFRSRLSSQAGILIERRQKAVEPLFHRCLNYFIPPFFFLLVFHFLQRLARSLDIGWHLRRLKSKDYVRLFLRAFLSNPTRCCFF